MAALILLPGLAAGVLSPPLADAQTAVPIAPCEDGRAIGLDELYLHCGVPGPCAPRADCDGRIARINASLSRPNLMPGHPSRGGERLIVFNADATQSLEVRVSGDGEQALRSALASALPFKQAALSLQGTLIPLDIYSMQGCQRAYALAVTDPDGLRITATAGEHSRQP